jgi:hypothetical protein
LGRNGIEGMEHVERHETGVCVAGLSCSFGNFGVLSCISGVFICFALSFSTFCVVSFLAFAVNRGHLLN